MATSLHIDGRQVIWLDGSGDFFFHDGSGTAAGTHDIDPAPASTIENPYLSDGVVTWFGRTGPGTDTEIFIMQ